MGPDLHTSTLDGNTALCLEGFTYLPRFLTDDESRELLAYFSGLHPLWEERYVGDQSLREGQTNRRLTRPVYWLGAWQFASLGYYAEPDHLEHRCVRAEPLHPVMTRFLERLHGDARTGLSGPPPNTCLINFYGSELGVDARGRPQPVDLARLKRHRDGEPGPVVMFSLGQPAQFEFVDPERPKAPELSLWLKHRSAVVLQGPRFKDQLYHQVTRVRFGPDPVMPQPVPGFSLRRISVSFRHVPERYICDLKDLPGAARAQVAPYVKQLADHSPHFAAQWQAAS